MSNSFSAHTSTKLFVLTIILAFAGFLTLTTSSALAFSGAGTGTTTDPYQITTIEQLYEINDDLTASYELMNDLDFCDAASYDDPNNGTSSLANYCEEETTGEGWDGIGEYGDPGSFVGEFDGGEHIIRNLYQNNTKYDSGLFSHVGINFGTDGTQFPVIKNIGIVDANITTESGAVLVGYSETKDNDLLTIENVFTTGTLSVTDYDGAGIIGSFHNVDINNAYTTVDVSGNDTLAGFGVTYSTGLEGISNTYSAGSVSGTGDTEGYMFTHGQSTISSSSAWIANNFFDTERAGTTSDPIAAGKTTAEMQSITTFTDVATEGLDSSWDITTIDNYTDETWVIDDGNDYPRFSWDPNVSFADEGGGSNSGGSGSILLSRADLNVFEGDNQGGDTNDTDESDDSDNEADDDESEEDEEDEINEQESQESSPSERISRLVQDVSQLQQDQNMTRQEKITRLRDILLDLVDILSGSLQ